MKRLQKMLQMVPMDGIGFIDVGTDHGTIPISLAKQNYKGNIYASEIHADPLRKAEQYAKEAGVYGRIQFLLCDGLSLCPADQIDCIMIAGMGGDTICRILDQAEWIFTGQYRIILQPMTHAEILRYWLVHNEFQIVQEEIVLEHGRVFQLFSAAIGKSAHYSDVEYYVGKLSDDRPKSSLDVLLYQEAFRLQKKVKGLSGQKNDASYQFYRTVLSEMEKLLKNGYGS